MVQSTNHLITTEVLLEVGFRLIALGCRSGTIESRALLKEPVFVEVLLKGRFKLCKGFSARIDIRTGD